MEEILKELFDEKILKIMELFIRNPERRFYLSEISATTRVNITTTFRILNKLSTKGFIKEILFGKTRIYQLEKNEKTFQLLRILKKDSDPLKDFVYKLKVDPRIKKIVLESRDSSSAKIIVVGNFIPTEKINRIKEYIFKTFKFEIEFATLNEEQYNSLKDFPSYALDKRIIWERN